MNRNDHHSHTMPVGDVVFAVAAAVPVELVVAAVEAFVAADVASVAVADAAGVAASFVAAGSGNGVVQHADPTCDPAQVGHGPSHYSSCCCYYCQTMHQRCYYEQPG